MFNTACGATFTTHSGVFSSCQWSPFERDFGRQKRTEGEREMLCSSDSSSGGQWRRWSMIKYWEGREEEEGGVCVCVCVCVFKKTSEQRFSACSLSISIKPAISKSLSKLDVMTLHLSVSLQLNNRSLQEGYRKCVLRCSRLPTLSLH